MPNAIASPQPKLSTPQRPRLPRATIVIKQDLKGGCSVEASFDPPCPPGSELHVPAAIAMKLLTHLQQLSAS